MQFSESICIINVDVDHYKNILDYLLGVLSIGKINPIFFFGTIKPTIFAIYFDTLGVRDMQFRNQFVLSMLMWIITKSLYITFCGSFVLLKLIPLKFHPTY